LPRKSRHGGLADSRHTLLADSRHTLWGC